MKHFVVNGKRVKILDGDISKEDLMAALKVELIGWDIETSGLDWQNERIGTCQIAISKTRVVIIKITEEVPQRLCFLLKHPKVKKVFHHAMFDLRFMSYRWNIIPKNIACTKIASKLLDVENTMNHSLKSVLKRQLRINIEKKERMSDWLATDLTQNQVSYAVKDVIYLQPLFLKLESQLKANNLAKLAKLCFNHIPTRVQLDIHGYRDIYEY